MSGVCLCESLCLIIQSENNWRRGPGILCKWYTLTILSTCVPLLKLGYLRYGGGGFTTFPWAQAAAHPDLPTPHTNGTVYTQRGEQAEPQTSWGACLKYFRFFWWVLFPSTKIFHLVKPIQSLQSPSASHVATAALIFFLVSVFSCMRLIHWHAFEPARIVHWPRVSVNSSFSEPAKGLSKKNMKRKIPQIRGRDRAPHTLLLNTVIVRAFPPMSSFCSDHIRMHTHHGVTRSHTRWQAVVAACRD